MRSTVALLSIPSPASEVSRLVISALLSFLLLTTVFTIVCALPSDAFISGSIIVAYSGRSSTPLLRQSSRFLTETFQADVSPYSV